MTAPTHITFAEFLYLLILTATGVVLSWPNALLAGCIPTFFIAEEGYERFIRMTQRTVESAVRDYNEYSRENLVLAEVSAHNLLTKEHLAGTFEIVGALNAHTLVFRGPNGRLHTLGNEYQSEYVAESAVCQRGRRASVQMRQLTLTNEPLADASCDLDRSRENQLFGHVRTAERLMLPETRPDFSPIAGNGQTLTFNYAFEDDIVALDLADTFVESGALTIRTIIPEDTPGSGPGAFLAPRRDVAPPQMAGSLTCNVPTISGANKAMKER